MGAEPVSGDEMTFGEIKYREPVRLLRPDRDRRYACLPYHVPAQADLPIFLDHRTADAIERHALADTSVELGGILLGKECIDEASGVPFVWISQALEAKHYANTQASFTYTHDSWEEITRDRDRLFPDLDIVGWYHTHPSFGIFLSHHDVFIHQHFFVQPLQVAYVVDPVQQTRGFFQWRDRNLAQVEGFYLTSDRGDRISLARLANDLENFPSTRGDGGMILSPRLEAELITMLSRPSAPQYLNSPGDRMLTGMIFGLLGSFLGVLGVAAAIWLYQLHGRVQDQSDSIRALTRSVEQVSGNQRLAMDTLLDRVGTDTPAQFAERYERAARARDQSRAELAAQQSINVTLGTRTKELEIQAEKLAADLNIAKKAVEKYEVDAKQAPELREKLVSLQQELSEKTPIVESIEGKNAADILGRLNIYRYATLFFGALSAALALAAGYLYLRPLEEPDPEHPVVPIPTQPQAQPHRIT
jgi:proteasome lid subunit RPN8/RPN11